jgi:CRISPR-associated exonuclease Cas4
VIRLSSELELLSAKLVSAIGNALDERYHIKREEARRELEQKYGKPVIFAHELLMCRVKQKFAQLFPELVAVKSRDPKIILGELVEAGVEKYLEKLGFRRPERAYIKDFGEFVLSGAPDYVDDHQNPTTVIDIKYSSTLPSLRPQHAARVRIYMNLAKAKRGIVLYISPLRVVSYSLEAPIDDSLIEELFFSIYKQNTSTPTAPLYSDECKYCEFRALCPVRIKSLGDENDVTSI